MRRAPVTVSTALIALIAGGVVALPALAATKSITIGDDYFIKNGGGTVTVKRGTTVKWLFKGEHKHTVVGSGAGRFINSGAPRDRGAYTVKARKTGTFKIVCTIHPGQKMKLKVT